MSEHPEIDNSDIFEMLDKYDESERKPYPWKIVLGLFCLIAVSVICLAAFFNPAGKPLLISTETTYITEPLRSDGKTVDYFRAVELKFYPPEMKTDENGFRIMLRAFGPNLFRSSTDPARLARTWDMCEKLGLPHPIIPTHVFLDTEDVFNAYPDNQERLNALNTIYSKPWTLEQFPEMEEWLEKMNPGLDIIAESVGKEVFCVPLTRKDEDETLFFTQLEMIQTARNIARMFSARANYRLAAGDIDGAIDDRIAIARLGRHIENHPFIVSLLVGIAIEGISNNLAICNPPDILPNAEQIVRLREELRNLPNHGDLMWQLETERYFALDAIQMIGIMKKLAPDELFSLHSYGIGFESMTFNRVDWSTVMQGYNEKFDRMLSNENFEYDYEREVTALDLRILTTKGRSARASDILAGLFVPSVYSVRESQRRAGCCENLREITLAMLLYHEEHGCLPPACSVDEDGNALHSWRVLILPQLGHKELYDKINLNEPWDSEYNKQFHTEDLAIYQCPSCSPVPGMTSYVVMVGDDLPFDGSGQGRKLSEFGPHSGNMILVSETKTCGDNWMNPEFDVAYEDAAEAVSQLSYWQRQNSTVNTFGSNHHGGFNVGKRNGAVAFISQSLAIEEFDAALKGIEYVPASEEEEHEEEVPVDETTEEQQAEETGVIEDDSEEELKAGQISD